MQTLKQKNKSIPHEVSNLYYSDSTSVSKLLQDSEVWNSSLDLTKTKKLKISLVEKAEWVLNSETKESQQSDEAGQIFVELPIAQEASAFDTRMDFIFQCAFLGNISGIVRDNAIAKLVPVALFFLFGSLDTLFKAYLVIACFCILLGTINDIVKKKLSFLRINKSIGQQIYMLFAIGILNVFINGLINQRIFGEYSIFLIDALVVWFFVTNFLSSIKYLSLLGVQFPKNLKSKIEAIKTILD